MAELQLVTWFGKADVSTNPSAFFEDRIRAPDA
jgi:hypothetical protein